MRQMRSSPAVSRVPQNGELEFALPVDTRGLPPGTYEVWIDMISDQQSWMALHGAEPFTTTLRIESFSHEISVDVDAVTLPLGASTVLSGTVRNTCGKPWPESANGEPLRIGARLFRPSAQGEAVREFRAALDRLPESQEDEVGFRLALDPGELERGDYELSIDVVKENRFWLVEKGATPTIIPVVIA
jgi:hypothetical protein